MTVKSGRGRRLFIAADIYGLTPALRALAADLGGEAEFLSPWPGEGSPHATEQASHAAFVAGPGLEAYAERIVLAAAGEPVTLVGFSVGATAAWLFAAGQQCHPDSRLVLFYGSRIRHYLDLRPRCRVEAIFVEHEAAFDPRAVAAAIASETVRTVVVAGAAHGFMNALSPGYDAALARRQIAALCMTAIEGRTL
ncbi:MAG: dienelactone hydrolase-like enzyme [Solidesulfovibrio magneticus str. Maddingley MBC34]|uniref:Dienelactone hydrolase-like enzyme n=1 Tax=Solidesulfovibrio magneticus str. Maddingley MBC34 TaxID=1206767 RepID=K6GGK9_9BACT|nr:MAG: dienelactone hydrolase-like enzyme [Solidesulfovibrio magneticus str. Maddingley MBC34]